MKTIKVIPSMAVLAMACGCAPLILAGAGAGAGAGTYAYVKGELKIEYPRSYESVWAATLNALGDRNITIEEKAKDGISGTIKARRATDTPVKVVAINKASGATVVRVRVGILGDREASILIKRAIDRRLGISSRLKRMGDEWWCS